MEEVMAVTSQTVITTVEAEVDVFVPLPLHRVVLGGR
jgi:hypothetical protein